MRIWLYGQENLPVDFREPLPAVWSFWSVIYSVAPVRHVGRWQLIDSVDQLLLVLCGDRVDEVLNSLLLIGREGGDPIAVHRNGIGRHCGRKKGADLDVERRCDCVEGIYIDINGSGENASYGGLLNVSASG